MTENPLRPFRPDPLRSAGPAVVMMQNDSRRLVVILFSIALVLGAGIGIVGFLAGRRSEVGKIHPTDIAPFPRAQAVQAANPPPPALQIVPLPEGSLVREEAPLAPGSPVVIGYDGGQPISIEGDGATGAVLEEKPAIVIRRHEPSRARTRSAGSPLVTPVAPVPANVPIPAAPEPAAEPVPVAPEIPAAASPEPPSAAAASPAAPTAAPEFPAGSPSDSAPDSSLEPSPPPP
ncbi:MAG: hypothetical protein ABJC13_21280 [Acidobacteriota bacterium]